MAERRLLADVTPLREVPAYRRFWAGSTLSQIGSAMTTFAVALQVYRITGSSVAVGGIGLATFGPLLIFGVVGGALGDSVDRRRLVLSSQLAQLGVSVVLAIQAFAGLDRVWLLYVLVASSATLAAINAPARRAIMPTLLPKPQIPAGAALAMLSMHTSVIVGPVIAGLIVPVGGLKLCYAVDAISYLGALYGVFRLPPMRAEGGPTSVGFAAIIDGFRHLGRSRVLTGLLLNDLGATLLAMPVALFPAINADRFDGSPRTLGLLNAGLAVGGLVGTVFSGPVSRVRRVGIGVLVASVGWGGALAGFGLVRDLPLTLAFLVVAGVADVTSVVLRSTVIQLATPDAFRGRINAAEITVGAGGPQLGNFRAGLVAGATSAGTSAAIGGFASVAAAVVIGVLFPALTRYRMATAGADPPVRR